MWPWFDPSSKMLLTLSWRRPLSYRNQSIDLQSKSMDWFQYDNGLRHERVNYLIIKPFNLLNPFSRIKTPINNLLTALNFNKIATKNTIMHFQNNTFKHKMKIKSILIHEYQHDLCRTRVDSCQTRVDLCKKNATLKVHDKIKQPRSHRD